MAVARQDVAACFEDFFLFGSEISPAEDFPDVVYGLFRGMYKVGRVETVVPKVVVEDFECGEIEAVRNACGQLLDGEHQGRLRTGIFRKTIFQVSYGAYGEYDWKVRMFGPDYGDGRFPFLSNFRYRQTSGFKIGGGHFVAIPDYCSGTLLQFPYFCRSEGYGHCSGLLEQDIEAGGSLQEGIHADASFGSGHPGVEHSGVPESVTFEYCLGEAFLKADRREHELYSPGD